VIYTGSANLSDNSTHNNDENLLEIRDALRLARTYLCEFLRLYEHYRVRARFAAREGDGDTFKLLTDSSWAKRAYTKDTPEYKAS
jgi:phosphatidylserine/phosphatidylglycerophosphate/cardiolipin synthase-like enzyme